MFTKKYFQDRPILFLNLFIVSMTGLTFVSSFMNIDTSKQFALIEYRLADGTDGFERAESPLELYTFLIAAIIFAAVAIFVSARLYRQKRFMSLMLLALTCIVLVFNFVVSWAVFGLQ